MVSSGMLRKDKYNIISNSKKKNKNPHEHHKKRYSS